MHRLGGGCTEMGQYEKNTCQNTAHCLNHPPLHPLPSREGKSEGFQHQSLENRPVPVLKTRPLPTLIPEEPNLFCRLVSNTTCCVRCDTHRWWRRRTASTGAPS